MTGSPPDPHPDQAPDLDEGGTVDPRGGTPSSASTSLASDSATTGQSPAPRGRNTGVVLALIVVGVVVLLVVIGLVGYAVTLG